MKRLLILSVIVTVLTGCQTTIGPNDPAVMDGYNTQSSPSSIEYGIYMNKQITVYINQLTTHMSTLANQKDGSIYENELLIAEESLKILQDVYDEVSLTMPPVNGEDDHEITLICMETAIGHMEEFIEALKFGENNLDGYANEFQNDIYGLTNMANLYYE